MLSYEYDKDYPFAAYITNLGKYNEGYLVGEWVKFPTTAEELKNVFQRIGIGAKDDFGAPYEEWFISDYDCYVDGLYDKLGEYANLDELNYLASKLDDMQQYEYDTFQAAMELGDHTGSIRDLINLTENLDCYDVYHGVTDHDDLGRYYIEELGAMEIPEHLENYFDYEAYGRDIALSENGTFMDSGYVYENGGRFMEVYDGSRDSIPDEYRIMGEAQDLLEEEQEMSREQMEAAGYGLHHQSEDGKYLIMGNGTRAFAIPAESHIRTAEMTVEDDYGMIDGIINNGRRGEEQDKAKAEAARTEKKPSVMERLNDAKKECAVKAQAKQAAPQKKAPELGEL